MIWSELKENVYFEDGSLRDIYIKDVSEQDWAKFVDYLGENNHIEWFNHLKCVSESKPNFQTILEQFQFGVEAVPPIKIFISTLQINAHIFSEDEIECTIDPKEFQSIEDHDILVSFLKKISSEINKTIIVAPENMPEFVLFEINSKKSE